MENMGGMFTLATSFDGDISGWDISSVQTMKGMFAYAESFDGDLSGWDVSTVGDMSSMFQQASSFDDDLDEWDVSNVEAMGQMFDGSGLTRQNYDALLVAWQDLDLEPDVEFSADETQYSSGAPAGARQYIIDEFGWHIDDGGLAA